MFVSIPCVNIAMNCATGVYDLK